MLRRLGSGVALASIGALVLAGCTPPEPTEEDLLSDARETFDGFFQAIDEGNAEGAISSEDLEPYATPDLAAQWAADVQATIDAGTTSRGVLEVVDVRLVNRSSDQMSLELCTDGRGIETTLADGSTLEPSELVAWSAHYVAVGTDDGPLLSALDPIQDQEICR